MMISLLLFLLTEMLPSIYPYANMMLLPNNDFYAPGNNGCLVPLTPNPGYCGARNIPITSDYLITVTRNNVSLYSGSVYLAGEILSISYVSAAGLFPREFIIEVKGTTFGTNSYCSRSRVGYSRSTLYGLSTTMTVALTMPTSGNVTLVGTWGAFLGSIFLSPAFTLKPSVSLPAGELSPTPTTGPTPSRQPSTPTPSFRTVSPVSPSLSPQSLQPTSSPSPPPSTLTPTAKPSTSTSPTVKPPTAVPTTSPLSFCKRTNYGSVASTLTNTCLSYFSIRRDFAALLPPTGTPANDLIRSGIFGKAIRLAFHDAAEIDITQADLLGPDGCLSPTAANAGLIAFGAVNATIVDTKFEPIYQKYCHLISRADFWTLIAWFAINTASGGAIPIQFQFGRRDAVSCPIAVDRLPKPQLGRSAIKQVFITQMGLSMSDAITLIGAHTIGHVHPEVSGYGVTPTPRTVSTNQQLLANAWDSTPQTFDNGYYANMITAKWFNNGDLLTNTKVLTDWARGGAPHLMLSSDLALAYNISTVNASGVLNQHCGPYSAIPAASTPVKSVFVGCQGPDDSSIPNTADLVARYASDNQLFLNAFGPAFKKMMSVGYGTGSSKLGGPLQNFNVHACEE